MMKKRNWIIGVIFAISVLIFFELYIRHDHPKFFEDFIQQSKNDEELKAKIGVIESFEYKFNKNDLSKDSLAFQITLIGELKNALYTGIAIKDSLGIWNIIKNSEEFIED